MPFYEYECSNCKFYVETLQKISDEPLRKCPSCKKQTMKKLISAPVFRLKGAGWYETDFKSEGEDKRNLADSDEPAEKAEDKPATDTKADGDAKGKDKDKDKDKGKEKKVESKAEVKTGAKKAPAKAAPSKGKKPAAKAPAKRPVAKKSAPAKKKAKRR